MRARARTVSKSFNTKSGTLGSSQGVVWEKEYLEIECPVSGAKEGGAVQIPGGEPGRFTWAWRGAFRKLPLQEGAEMEQSCFSAAGLLPPGRSVFVLACSERAWAGSPPRGLALARHSYRLDTMILTQIPHT